MSQVCKGSTFSGFQFLFEIQNDPVSHVLTVSYNKEVLYAFDATLCNYVMTLCPFSQWNFDLRN